MSANSKEIVEKVNAAFAEDDLEGFLLNLPGLGLHELSGDRQGDWAVKVSGNWRVTFRFSGKDADAVDYEDYH
jgi:plasmid maintenance system killer protein